MRNTKKWLKQKLKEKVESLKQKKYDYFFGIDKPRAAGFCAWKKNDDFYQVEMNVFFEDAEQKDIRVMLAIDNGGWRSFFPITESIVVKGVE